MDVACRRWRRHWPARSRSADRPRALIDIVLRGRDQDPAYPSMPPLAALSDDELAGILTYVRQAWGNTAPPVTPADVRARRTTAP